MVRVESAEAEAVVGGSKTFPCRQSMLQNQIHMGVRHCHVALRTIFYTRPCRHSSLRTTFQWREGRRGR